MNILFRVDSSSKIGHGHVMRCLVLAKQYREDNVIFATQDLKGNANQKIIDESYKLIALNDGSVNELVQRINELNIDMVVFDHYGINSDFEKAVKGDSGVKILSFDDVYEKHYCDILLNHNIYADAGKYKDLVPDFCEIRCGKKYTLVRDEFKKIEIKKNPSNKGKLVVFVCLGGADANNISLPVLEMSWFTRNTKNWHIVYNWLPYSKPIERDALCPDVLVADFQTFKKRKQSWLTSKMEFQYPRYVRI